MVSTLSKQDATLAKQWDDFWGACEMQRYGATHGNLESLKSQLIELAKTTENTLS